MILLWEHYSVLHEEWFQLFQDYDDCSNTSGGITIYRSGHGSPYVVKIGHRKWKHRNMCRVLPFDSYNEARELLKAFDIQLDDTEVAENILAGGLDIPT
jgi:hypothetical protein